MEATNRHRRGGKGRGGRDTLGPESFDRLLDWLDHDRDLAAQSYERLHEKLTRFFEWRGALEAAELADRTFDRVSRKLLEGGAPLEVKPVAYCFGVARNILREHRGERARRYATVRELFHTRSGERDSVVEKDDRHSIERRARCLQECLERLPASDRELIIAYYQGEKHAKLENRKALATRMGIGMNALWIRCHRLRLKLENCLEERLKVSPPERNDPESPL